MTAMVPNLRGPLGLKSRDDGKDPSHLAKVRALGCVICEAWGMQQLTPTEAHHAICGRHSQRRVPDRQTVALCRCHHQGDTGTGRIGIHKSRAAWVRLFGPDTDWVSVTLDRVEAKT